MTGEGNGDEGWRRSGIEVSALQFGYDGQPPLFARFNLRVAPGSRCLLVGANGSGKTTLLKILAGKHMVGGRDVVRVLNGSAFHDTQLVCNGDLSYLGGSWSRTIGSAGDVPLQGDFSAEHMIFGGILSHCNAHAHHLNIYHTWFLIDRRDHVSHIPPLPFNWNP